MNNDQLPDRNWVSSALLTDKVIGGKRDNLWCFEGMIMVLKISNPSKIIEKGDQPVAYITETSILKLQFQRAQSCAYSRV